MDPEEFREFNQSPNERGEGEPEENRKRQNRSRENPIGACWNTKKACQQCFFASLNLYRRSPTKSIDRRDMFCSINLTVESMNTDNIRHQIPESNDI